MGEKEAYSPFHHGPLASYFDEQEYVNKTSGQPYEWSG